ncbi:hypothetical protein HKCCE3408_12730 [Rhodobacterales bacterium HKCCE3408]|nr:hypothetical protein [Rhodobacterales bacterium HKCCE3408]
MDDAAPGDLTGFWIGRYAYDHGGPPVPMEIEMIEIEGRISGSSREPNTFRPSMGTELFAEITGSRNESMLAFTKRYTGFEQGGHPYYSGAVNGDGTRIEGRWGFPGHDGWGGTFRLSRKPQARARAEQKQAAEAASGASPPRSKKWVAG